MNHPFARPLPSGVPYLLQHGPYEASVASIGASLRTLRHEGNDLVVPFDADAVRPLFRGVILAPWPNRVVDGRYRDAAGEHQLALTEPDRGHALHGLVAWLDFRPVEQADDRLFLRGEIVPQQGYPHRVQVDVHYRLNDEGLTTEVVGTNTGPTTAPWGTGPHPYLRAGAGRVDDWTLRLPADQVLEVTPDRLVPTRIVSVDAVPARSFDFRGARPIGVTFLDHAFTDLHRDDDGWARVTLVDTTGGGVAVAWDDSCEWVQVHTADRPDPAEHRVGLAVEPMTCAPDAYNSGRGLVHLEPGTHHVARWRISRISAAG